MSEVLRHRGVRWISAGIGGFLAENLIMSENREWIIENIPNGQAGYHSLYNTLSSIACLSVAWGYFRHGRGQGPRILTVVGGTRLISSFILRAGGLYLTCMHTSKNFIATRFKIQSHVHSASWIISVFAETSSARPVRRGCIYIRPCIKH